MTYLEMEWMVPRTFAVRKEVKEYKYKWLANWHIACLIGGWGSGINESGEILLRWSFVEQAL